MGNWLGILSVLCVAAGVIVVLFQLRANHLRRTNRCYARLARRFRGQLVPAELFRTPRVKFVYQGTPVVVDVQAVGGRPPNAYTRCRIGWSQSDFRCEVYPDTLGARLTRHYMGMQDIQIGSPVFDHHYVITGNDHDGVRRLLSDSVQRRIDQLRAWNGSDDAYVSISGGWLLCKKSGFLRDEELLQQFVQLSLEVYDQAMVATAKGIEFLPDEGQTTFDEAICQICGDLIRQPAVFCRSCKTPHHMDCWQYYGGCSTYGCGETKHTPAKPSDS